MRAVMNTYRERGIQTHHEIVNRPVPEPNADTSDARREAARSMVGNVKSAKVAVLLLVCSHAYLDQGQLDKPLPPPLRSTASAREPITACMSAGSLAARGWQLVVGLEVHAQVLSATKLFSSGFAAAGKAGSQQAPNSACALFDVAHPGTLPSLNRECVSQALRASAALDCRLHAYSVWERKHYLYPDLPHGFQLTQLRYPIASCGALRFDVAESRKQHAGGAPARRPCAARIARIQLETDAGKSVHTLSRDGRVLIDFNRAGVALLEIVTQPDLRGADEAAAFLRKLQVSAYAATQSGLHVDDNVLMGACVFLCVHLAAPAAADRRV
jgi:hypothetical protein